MVCVRVLGWGWEVMEQVSSENIPKMMCFQFFLM